MGNRKIEICFLWMKSAKPSDIPVNIHKLLVYFFLSTHLWKATSHLILKLYTLNLGYEKASNFQTFFVKNFFTLSVSHWNIRNFVKDCSYICVKNIRIFWNIDIVDPKNLVVSKNIFFNLNSFKIKKKFWYLECGQFSV